MTAAAGVALTVQAEIESRAAEADTIRASHVERARHRADLARRRYLAVAPNNQLVAGTLEADWNQALRALQAAQDDYDHATPATAALTEHHKARIRTATRPGCRRRARLAAPRLHPTTAVSCTHQAGGAWFRYATQLAHTAITNHEE